MNTKLTLMVDNNIIKKAKHYAKANNISLSKLVEFYFKSMSKIKTKENLTLPPITKELSGMIKADNKIKYKDILSDALMEKYL